MSTDTYLVLSATGRQGSAVVDALLGKGANVFGSSRNPESLRKSRDGKIQAVQADMNSTASIVAAIDESKATKIWFTTDYYSIPKATRAKEAQLGFNVINAVKERSDQVRHVVFNSLATNDNITSKMEEFWSKLDIEKYMKQELGPLKITWSILRPVAFMDNFDDARNGNPLKKGSVKFLTKADSSIKYISCTDIGKGSAELLLHPDLYAGQTINAATCEYTGPELAEILSEVSGTKCEYGVVVPKFFLFLFARHVYDLKIWFEGGGYDDIDMGAFQKLVPNRQDARAWFTSKGHWANGEKFLSHQVGRESIGSSLSILPSL